MSRSFEAIIDRWFGERSSSSFVEEKVHDVRENKRGKRKNEVEEFSNGASYFVDFSENRFLFQSLYNETYSS